MIGRIRRRIALSFGQARNLWIEGNYAKAVYVFFLSLAWVRRPVEVRINSQVATIRCCTGDFLIARDCFGGEFDAAIEAAKPLRYGLIIDAGRYIGTAAMMLAKAFPAARILSLEPSQDNFAVLRKNAARFPNIIAINKALGGNERTMQLRNRGTGEWGYSIVQNPQDCKSPEALHDVEVRTIPALLKEYGSDGIDLLKLDIEGGEYELFHQPPPWLNLARVVIAELHERIVPGCEEAFRSATAGRKTIASSDEKVISVRAG